MFQLSGQSVVTLVLDRVVVVGSITDVRRVNYPLTKRLKTVVSNEIGTEPEVYLL